jgi:integrase
LDNIDSARRAVYHRVAPSFVFLGQLWANFFDPGECSRMARQTDSSRLLPANTKAIQRAVKLVSGAGGKHTEFRIRGARGLVLHVLPSGTATWYVHYDVDVGNKRDRRKLKIGRLDEVSLAQAAEKAEQLRPMIRQGADPAFQKNESRRSMTFADIATERTEKGDPLRPGTQRDYWHLLRRDVLPLIGSKPARDVTREDIIRVLDAISMRGASRRADTARAVISSIYGHAMDRGLVSSNPAAGLRNRHDYQPRDVVASDDDIRRLCSAMDSGEAAMSLSVIRIVKLALLTGLRRTELAAARKSELDLDLERPVLTIPTGRAKNRYAHRVPLSAQAAALFREAVEAAGDSEFVFPSEKNGSHIASRSVSKAMERTREKLGIADITMHDLRRTAGTYMSRLGVPKEVRERILNHGGSRKGNMTDGVYNHYTYEAEKRAALELWADALDSIIGGIPTEIDRYHVRLSRHEGIDTIRLG